MPSKEPEPESVVVPATEWDREPMKYTVVPATDRDGNPVEDDKPATKPAAKPKEN